MEELTMEEIILSITEGVIEDAVARAAGLSGTQQETLVRPVGR